MSVNAPEGQQTLNQRKITSEYANKLRERSTHLDIEHKIRTSPGTGEEYHTFRVGNDQHWRFVYIYTDEEAKLFLELPIEAYLPLRDLDAIANTNDGTIEAVLWGGSLINKGSSQQQVAAQLTHQFNRLIREEDLTFKSTANDDSMIELGPMSESTSLILGYENLTPPLCMRIQGVKWDPSNLESVVEGLGNGLLFQVVEYYGIPITLRRRTHGNYYRGDSLIFPGPRPTFPSQTFDSEPMQLFWYAKSAGWMPLFQYLAFYQVIEFYFLKMVKGAVRSKVGEILDARGTQTSKFDTTNEIIKAVEDFSRIQKEKEQLKFVLSNCVETTDLEAFLNENDDRRMWLATSPAEVSGKVLETGGDRSNLLQQVAERVYDIRCKIVHTKAGYVPSGIGFLLPHSKYINHFAYDIDLIEFLARRVVAKNPKPLS